MAPEVGENLEVVSMFKGLRNQNMVFLLDTSENMKNVLGSGKHLLTQALLARSSHRECLFNIMAFSNKLNRWSQNMLPCAPDTVYEALSWVDSLICGPGRDLQAALSMALMDPYCNAVHLVTTGPPGQREVDLHALNTVTDGRTVNLFYLLDHSSPWFNSAVQDHLQCPAIDTRGSCYVIPVGSNGTLTGKVVPFHMTESHKSWSSPCPVKSLHVPSIHIPHQHMSHLLHRCSLGNHCATTCVPCDLPPYSRSINMGYFPGCRVLARRQPNGLYYLGTLVQECRSGLWWVELDDLESSSSVSKQLVCTSDMIHHTRAHANRLVPGDAVMSPWEPGVRKYGPGVVIEQEDPLSAYGSTSLWVRMWNGCVALVPRSLVVHIPSSEYSRLARDLQLDVTASSANWPCTPTPPWAYLRGCPSTPATCYCRPIPCHGTSACSSALVRGDGCEAAEMEREAGLLFENHAAIETGRSKSSSAMAYRVTIGASPPWVRPKKDQNRPPWRYWRRSTPEPQHRKPGKPAPGGALQPARFSFGCRVNLSPNHSSMFKTLAGSVRRADIREVFEGTNFRPRPPAGSKPDAAFSVHARMN